MRQFYILSLVFFSFLCTTQVAAQVVNCDFKITAYRDSDFDGFGDPGQSASVSICLIGVGYSENFLDCDDNNENINPNTIWYKDADNDGYSDGTTIKQCARPPGYKLSSELTATSGDCDDSNASLTPSNCCSFTRLYVKWNASGTGDGSTWTNAYTKLQDAIAKAGTCTSVKEIWVAAGTYYPDEGSGIIDNNRNRFFNLISNVALYGGFAGTETALNQRNWTTNVTTLSGEIQQDNDINNNTYHVIYSRAVLNTAILDGFTISGGNANVVSNGSGGGMLNIENAAPVVANCIFSGNRAEVAGAGISSEFSSLTVTNCGFYGNTAPVYGAAGAIFFQDGSLTIANSIFSGNTAMLQAGAIQIHGNCTVTVINSLFRQNSTQGPGGAIYHSVSDATSSRFINCSFSENNANQGGAFANSGPITISNCILWGDTGGEIFSISSLTVNNSIVQGGYAGTGNLDNDPLFADAANGNLHLQPCSPAINAGNNAAIPAGVITDLDGNARIVNATVDMGAFEVQASSFKATVTSITSNNNPSFTTAPGEAVTLTATITSGGNPVTTGTVTFTDGAFLLGSAPLNSSGQASLADVFDSEGSFNITATYNATCEYTGSSASIVQTADNHTNVTGNTFCNDRSGIVISETITRPYPSHIFVSGLSNTITKLRVKLNGFSHDQISNLFALLVAPGGQKILLMGSADNGSASNVNLVLDDAAPTFLPPGVILASGTYRPSFFFPSVNFPAPAPLVSTTDFPFSAGTATFASKFNGTDPNGTWSLYVFGKTMSGSIDSWCLEITTDVPPVITCPSNIIVNNDPGQCGATVNLVADNKATATGIPAPDITYKIGDDIITWPHSFAIGTTTVTAIATNEAGTDQCNFTVTVHDTENPSLTAPTGITAYTGTDATICGKLIASGDLGTADYGDNCPGAGLQITGVPSGNVFPVGETILTYTVTDAAGLQKTATQKITVVDNTVPVLNCPANITVYTGTRTTCDQVATWTAPIPTDNCGVKSLTSNYTSGAVFPKGTTTVTYTATDISDNVTTCSFTVTVIDNTAPIITGVSASKTMLWPPNHKMEDVYIGYTATDNCGSVITSLSVTSNQPVNGTGDGDTDPDWTIVDNHHVQLRAERGNSSEARVYTIMINATDGTNTTTTQTMVIVAHNITGPVTGTPFKIGSTVSFSGVFWDKPGNKHTGKWLIDDNTAAKATITEPSGTKNGKATGSYKFTTAGVYKLQMNVTDQNGITSYANTNEDMEAIVVIYDPNGGYAYGGGQFISPKGALVSNPSATGKVSYGFTVNYYKGATTPKGEAQFEFKVGNLEYNAVNFEYLSISGAKAVIKGSGKIVGGQSGIQFMMYVTDGALDGTKIDKVRIKIYNKNTGQVYYDNQPGNSDAANPVIAVANGSSIVISGSSVKGSTTASRGVVITEQESTPETFDVIARPNPTYTNFQLTVKGADPGKEIKMMVTDLQGRMMEQRILINEQTVSFGDNYLPGMYIVNIVQGKQSRQLKLVKLPD